jgi:O-acetyl-ADP-ribose deacetylase (regulator of RNase III)
VGSRTIVTVRGDITREETDAIVNAANESLLGGGGVDGAIHRAGGPEILEECKTIGGCPTGEARITTGGKLRARHVIHTVGPVWQGGGSHEAELLSRCYRNSLSLAAKHQIKSIAFPSISTGAYGYPVVEAAKVAMATVAAFLRDELLAPHEVRFVLFDDRALRAYDDALRKLGDGL